MNPLNYGSLEASKRLVEAGIVLETEAVRERHRWPGGERWILVSRGIALNKTIPAPSMAEVWRELPNVIEDGGVNYYFGTYATPFKGLYMYGYYNLQLRIFIYKITDKRNPTDALIDLLIRVRKEKP